MNPPRLLVRLFLALALLTPSAALAYGDGINGYSGRGGTSCNSCHSGGSTPSVALTGPATLAPGATGTFTLTIQGGPAVDSGFDVAATGGTLAAADASSLVMGGEVTHARPKAFSGGAASYSFKWTAPAAAGSHTLYGAGLSSDGNGRSGDGTGTVTLGVTVQAAPAPVCTAGQTRACYSGAAGTQGVGTCKAGSQACSNNAWGGCVGEVLPKAEICADGLDNDCDGSADDGCPVIVCTAGQTRACYTGAAATQGVGACKAGTQTCRDNAWSGCVGEVLPKAEVCFDAIDDTCDGRADEGCPALVCTAGQTRSCFSGVTGTQGVGVCKAGSQTCKDNAWGACAGEVLAGAEQCGDGLDNDCDGQVDDGCAVPVCSSGQTRPCYSGPAATQGAGVCKAGTQTCSANAWGACSGEVLPKAEVCGDNLDNDCDGQIDDGCAAPECEAGQTRACYSGPAGTEGVGVCKAGTQACDAGAWNGCIGMVLQDSELCGDGLDNDCDGQADEDCPATACTTGAIQLCRKGARTGLQRCDLGSWGACRAFGRASRFEGNIASLASGLSAEEFDALVEEDELLEEVEASAGCSAAPGSVFAWVGLLLTSLALLRRRRA